MGRSDWGRSDWGRSDRGRSVWGCSGIEASLALGASGGTATQDFGTLTTEWKANDWITVANRFRLEHSLLDYIGTIPESPAISNPNPLLWTVTANPQSRRQTTDVIANQTDVTFKYDLGDIRNTTVAGVEISRERVNINAYTGLSSENVTSFSGGGSLPGVNIFAPQFTYLPFPGAAPTLGTNPTDVPVDTKAAYVIQTANIHDVVILNGGLRYDDYNVRATNNAGSTSIDTGLVNYNLGVTYKPLPNASVYAAYATSSNPVGAELDATGPAYGGLAPASNSNQVFGPERNKAVEVGTKWELFDRRLLATAALFQTEKSNARELATINGVANTIVAGADYRIRGIDLGIGGKITDEWSVFGGLVLMKSKVLKSLVASADPALYSSNVGLPLANIAPTSFSLLSKYQLTDKWELGGQAVYRSAVPGALCWLQTRVHRFRASGASTPSPRRRLTSTGRPGCSSTTSSTSSITSACTKARSRSCWRRRAARLRCRSRQGSDGLRMLICVPNVLSKDEVAEFRRIMDASAWEDGRSTAGAQSALVKRNEQLPPDSDVARKLGKCVISALTANPRFISAAIPLHIFPPLFNRYVASDGHHFGIHVDNAVRGDHLTGQRIRTDLSVTLFLSEPKDYDGGELVVEDLYGSHEIKLPAGDLVLYPASSLHMVTPVTRGARVASFFWLQSMIRDAHARSLIFDLDTAIQALVSRLGRDDPETVKLTGIYHNLIRYWAEV